jgi:hypothetical protein
MHFTVTIYGLAIASLIKVYNTTTCVMILYMYDDTLQAEEVHQKVTQKDQREAVVVLISEYDIAT